jgi:putative transposase
MTHHNIIFSQILKLVPRHEFASLAKRHDVGVRSDAMNRWTQFVAMSTAQLSGRSSLRDIESTISSQKHLRYHLGSGEVRRTTLSRANQDRPVA